MPSALIGLVAFSFVLLGIGAASYTVSLPALIAATRNDISDGFLSSMLSTLLRQPADEEAAGVTVGPEDSPSAGDSAAGNQQAASGHGPITLGGISIDGLISDAVDQGSQGQDPSNPGGATDQPGSGGSAEPEPEPEPKPEPDPTPDPAVEQQIYDFLVPRAQSISGYVDQVNACVASFNQNCTASLETRLSCQRACDALYQQLFDEYNAMLNSPLMRGLSYSRYAEAYADLIAMFRCLFSYVGTIGSAWTANVVFEDPLGHEEEFLAPIRADMVNGENKYYTEFKAYAEGFVL